MKLHQDKLVKTLEILQKRMLERFPNSSLGNTCTDFIIIVKNSKLNINQISKPNVLLRIVLGTIVIISVIALVYSVSLLKIESINSNFTNILTLSETIVNVLIFIGVAIYFVFSVEVRVKRKRALKSLNELRVIVHVIDMHQLTKDPFVAISNDKPTTHSPKRELNNFELQRYLNYCSEMSSIVGKVSTLYSQALPDPVIVNAVNDIEVISTGVSRKIWQKLNILNSVESNSNS